MNISQIDLVIRKKGLARPQGLFIDGVEMKGVKHVQVGYPLDGAREVTVTFLAEFREVEPEGDG